MTIKEYQEFLLKIGSKGEIFPPKELREKLGLHKDQPILLTLQGDKLIIRKVDSLEEILSNPSKVTISSHAWKQFRKTLSEDAER
ncbi:MAG: hypothetical protein GF364_16825 [Candidatus Lokiarchaeota archaeon]|nr:hypothetical protein [Candidatus Lokiarchaeota archaeon]